MWKNMGGNHELFMLDVQIVKFCEICVKMYCPEKQETTAND